MLTSQSGQDLPTLVGKSGRIHFYSTGQSEQILLVPSEHIMLSFLAVIFNPSFVRHGWTVWCLKPKKGI
jgi:hypothetical protein